MDIVRFLFSIGLFFLGGKLFQKNWRPVRFIGIVMVVLGTVGIVGSIMTFAGCEGMK